MILFILCYIMRFEDKKVIITGASSGIGRATAIKFRKEGAEVLLVARSKDLLKNLASELDSTYFAMDLTANKAAELIIGEATLLWGKIDVLVNAAGIIKSGTILDTTIEDFDYMMNLNLRSIFHLMQTAIPFLKETKGNIVNVSSVIPPGCKLISKEEGLKKIKPGEITEEEVTFFREQKICLVCKGKELGFTYICPKCEAFYCVKCAQALSNRENACWVCDEPFDKSKPSKPYKLVEEDKKVLITENDQKLSGEKRASKKNP